LDGTYSNRNINFFEGGGAKIQTEEFIYSGCNGYPEKEHSIDNRIGWMNKRVF